MTDVSALAAANMDVHLRRNPYPGRGLVIGRSSNADAWFIIYWIMGRSIQSRNRKLIAVDAIVRTEPLDVHLLTDPSLIIYEAILHASVRCLISGTSQQLLLLVY